MIDLEPIRARNDEWKRQRAEKMHALATGSVHILGGKPVDFSATDQRIDDIDALIKEVARHTRPASGVLAMHTCDALPEMTRAHSSAGEVRLSPLRWQERNPAIAYVFGFVRLDEQIIRAGIAVTDQTRIEAAFDRGGLDDVVRLRRAMRDRVIREIEHADNAPRPMLADFTMPVDFID